MGAAWPGGGGRWWVPGRRRASVEHVQSAARSSDPGLPAGGTTGAAAPPTVLLRGGYAVRGAENGAATLPFGHQDWQVRYLRGPPPRDTPLRRQRPRPLHSRFSLDLLSLLASSALVWLIVEVLAVLLGLYLVAVNSELTPIDLVTFSGYKYVGMIAGLLAGLVFGKTGYYTLLSWCCVLPSLSLQSVHCT